MNIAALYLVFAKFGLLCFGGGYMLIPLLRAELVGNGSQWPLQPEEFASLVSIAQATPGRSASTRPPTSDSRSRE